MARWSNGYAILLQITRISEQLLRGRLVAVAVAKREGSKPAAARLDSSRTDIAVCPPTHTNANTTGSGSGSGVDLIRPAAAAKSLTLSHSLPLARLNSVCQNAAPIQRGSEPAPTFDTGGRLETESRQTERGARDAMSVPYLI